MAMSIAAKAKVAARHNAKYEPVDSVPAGLTWKLHEGRPSNDHTVHVSFGRVYKRVVNRKTGFTQYFKLKDAPAAAPAEKIDAEPKRAGQVRYRVGGHCWFVDATRWYLVEVVSRVGRSTGTVGDPKRIVIKPVTGWDADHQKEWPNGAELEFPSTPNNPLFQRLRPLKDRKP